MILTVVFSLLFFLMYRLFTSRTLKFDSWKDEYINILSWIMYRKPYVAVYNFLICTLSRAYNNHDIAKSFKCCWLVISWYKTWNVPDIFLVFRGLGSYLPRITSQILDYSLSYAEFFFLPNFLTSKQFHMPFLDWGNNPLYMLRY